VQQAHTAKTRRLSRATSAHCEDQEAESCNKRTQRRRARARRPDALRKLSRRPAALRKLSARETTGRATEAVGARDDRAQERAESDKRYISGDQRGARPVARAAGRAEHQPVRVTSALKKGPRATSAEPAETSRRSETSGASCRTSQEPAVPHDKRSQKRISHQGRRPRGKRAERAKLWVAPGTSGAKEFKDGRERQAALRRSCLLRH
jgi:hypothetical protein